MSTVRDPVRLVADASVPDSERALLRHGTDIAPPPEAEARVWQGLAGVLGAAALGGAADASAKTITTAATKMTGAGLTGAKVVALVAVLAGAVAVGGYLLTAGNEARPPVAAAPGAAAEPAAATPAPPASPSVGLTPPPESAPAAPATIDGAPAPAPGPRKTHAPTRPAGAAAPFATPASSAVRLREETTLIRDARQALRQGDAGRALRLLDECRRLFPAGVLQQERERLAIEALAKSGRASEASARAAAFLRKYPDSPHAGEIRGLGLGEPAGR